MAPSASVSKASFGALLIAVLLAVRLVTPSGFMPAFEHGRMTIVICPEVAPAPMMGHHHGHTKSHQHPCPYAAASSLGGLPGALLWFTPVLAVAASSVLGSAFDIAHRLRAHERPPLRGPPVTP